MTTQNHEQDAGNNRVTVFCMISYLTCFVAAGIVSQVYSGIPPIMDYSPLDYFTGGALWIASALSLVMATTYSHTPWKMLFWLGGCVALSLLAIDEFMGMHEATEKLLGDDDHSKVILWAGTPIGLYLICRVERVSTAIATVFAVGFVLQTAYICVDVGDGDYFTLPFALTTLQWSEDICELLFVTTYVSGFIMLLSREARFNKRPPLGREMQAARLSADCQASQV